MAGLLQGVNEVGLVGPAAAAPASSRLPAGPGEACRQPVLVACSYIAFTPPRQRTHSLLASHLPAGPPLHGAPHPGPPRLQAVAEKAERETELLVVRRELASANRLLFEQQQEVGRLTGRLAEERGESE